jgi:hypothetical protein
MLYFVLKVQLKFYIDVAEENELDIDSDDESFHYPGSSPTSTSHMRPPSTTGSRRSQPDDYFDHPTITRTSTDLTPHLSQAPEFRVPTHEAPQKVVAPRGSTPLPHSLQAEWVRDDTVTECFDCKRRFNFLFRKVGDPSLSLTFDGLID